MRTKRLLEEIITRLDLLEFTLEQLEKDINPKTDTKKKCLKVRKEIRESVKASKKR